jgi:formylglycine-generating enzyme required for sulfatase activity
VYSQTKTPVKPPVKPKPKPAAKPAQGLAPFTVTLPKSAVKIKMVPVPGGTIKVGDKTVVLKPYWISETEIPWEAFDVFLASGPPSPPYDQTEFKPDAVARPSKSYILPDLGWGHAGFPVINVSSTSADMFGRWLASVAKKKFRLPTEAEWEWAARAGAPAKVLTKADADRVAWHEGNSDGQTHPVGKKQANKWGVFDMLGNAGEWATDLAGEPVLCGPTFEDTVDKLQPSVRRVWEPAWQESDPQFPKSRWWLANGPFAGLRVVCVP